MSRPPTVLLFAAASAVAFPCVRAQTPDSSGVGLTLVPRVGPTAAPTGAAGARADACTYDTCALRIEEGLLVRGVYGRRVATPTLLGSLSRGVEWRSDVARQYARRADARHRNARLLQSAGALTSAAAVVLLVQSAGGVISPGDGGGDGPGGTTRVRTGRLYTAAGLQVGAVLLNWAGNAAARGARQQIARAVWWHNRELVRPVVTAGSRGEL